MDVRIHRPMVLRLARYLRVLQKLKGLGFVKVFSNNLGDAIGATAAVVRKSVRKPPRLMTHLSAMTRLSEPDPDAANAGP